MLDPDLDGVALGAEALLRRRPTPLAQATRLVADYESRLVGLLQKHGPIGGVMNG
ncbi:MAG: hypothetical protein ACR2PL_08305 [Dehalococcoidia bacterium]